MPESQGVLKLSISLFAEQHLIVQTFADEQHRPFSNALQFIIDDWACMKRTAIAAAAPAAPAPEPQEQTA
jgi:hypothetical protein